MLSSLHAEQRMVQTTKKKENSTKRCVKMVQNGRELAAVIVSGLVSKNVLDLKYIYIFLLLSNMF